MRDTHVSLASLLLDSSLIKESKKICYQIKLIRVGEYYQLYYYNRLKIKKDKNLEEIKKKIDNDFLIKKDNYIDKPEKKIIEEKNINRSKFQFQRLVRTNESKFKTFITLTFKENITDVKEANYQFKKWVIAIRQLKKDFLYIGVPEFQKRGAVHYHLLTNLDIKENHNIIIPQKNNKNCYDVKFWSYGFSSVFDVKNINVVGYMSKYMTKSCDNRLFAHRRYFYSRNLEKPEEFYLDTRKDFDFTLIADLLSNSNVTYENSYLDKFGDVIDFIELKKRKE